MAEDPAATAPRLVARPRSASILINNFNYGRFVGAAIDSALAQTLAAQVIVVDDGSTDDSRQVIDRYGSRLQTVYTANHGQGAAMNAAFALATGDVVIFLDADDMLVPHVVETILQAWQPGCVLLQYPLHIVDVDGRRRGVHPNPPSTLSYGDVRAELLDTGSFGVNVTSGLAFLRDALLSIMPMPPRVRNAADGYLVRAVAFSGHVQRLAEPLGFYRQHASNDSNVAAAAGGLADGFRKKLEYARSEFEVTREFAARHGLETRPDLGDRNADYVGYQLFLLLIDRSSRGNGLRRRDLLPRYLATRWSSAWPIERRLMAMAIATAATFAPVPVATTLLSWLHDPQQRPAVWRYLSRRLRRT